MIVSYTMKVNSEKILSEIRRLGWSQARLAKEIGITRQAINYIIKESVTKISTLNKIGKALNFDPKDLLI